MPKTANIDQIVSMYWEADRSAVKKRYNELFGFRDEPEANKDQTDGETSDDDETSDDEEVKESDPDSEANPDESDGENFDDELMAVFEAAEITTPIQGMLGLRWNRFDDRAKVVALHFAYSIINAKGVDFHAMEGLVRLFAVEGASHLCHCFYPEVAVPINQDFSYLTLRAIFNLYGIEFDDGKKLDDYEVWQNINNAAIDYCEQNKLEPWQFWALIYDLGPRLLPKPGPYPTDVPPRVWIVATNDSLGEFAQIDKHGSEYIGTWAINKRARRGDIALMYCVTPRSAIVSVYRVAGDAHYDPFGGWNGYRGEVTDKIAIPWIRFSEMKDDLILKEWGLVKSQFQGLLHHEVPQEIWQRFCELAGMKDSDSAERLQQYATAAEGARMIKVANEKWSEAEVEERLVIPLLQELGWTLEKTLDRQVEMSVKIGSGMPRKVKADFVGYRAALGSDSLLVVETKRRIRNQKDLSDAVEQAESYASKLRCTRFAVAAPEGLWVYELRFPGQSNQIATVELGENVAAAHFAKLKPLIGYESLRG
jgi:hypothetical protein